MKEIIDRHLQITMLCET